MTGASTGLTARGPAWGTCVLLLLLAGGTLCAKEREWLKEAIRMESLANEARTAYWCGRYEEADRQFAELGRSVHPSVILYLNESAMCSLARGEGAQAEQYLRHVDELLNTYRSAEGEKRAVSAFGAEAEKVYRGDPYEQAAAYLLLALLLMDRGDYDNALAACKSGILADSDASENLFDSDIALLHALEAKCCLLRGDQEAFRARRDAAAKGVRLTSLQVREDVSKRADLLALLKMSRAERRKLGDKRTDDQIRAEIDALSATLDRRIESIDAASPLGPLYSGDYNVLVLVPSGRCVRKVRTGAEAEMILFVPDPAASPMPDLYLDEQSLGEDRLLATTVDVDFQATTRGGRRMDAILRGKAASRATTRGLGQNLTEVGSQAGGIGGLGLALIGGLMQGTAGAMTPDADTRCWQTLPKCFHVHALRLGPGSHQVRGSHYVYFGKRNEFQRQFSLTDDTDMAVVIVPPAVHGLYFARSDATLTERDQEGLEQAATLLVPPPTGLDVIVRVGVGDDREKPEAIAPDPKRLARAVRQALLARGIPAALVTHDEVLKSRVSLAQKHPLALQCEFVEITKQGTRKSGSYDTKLAFSLVETGTGRTVLNQTVAAACTDIRNGPSTAFYRCVESAAAEFAASPDFARCRRAGP